MCSIYTAASQVRRCLLSRKENEEEEKRRKSERGGTFLTFFSSSDPRWVVPFEVHDFPLSLFSSRAANKGKGREEQFSLFSPILSVSLPLRRKGGTGLDFPIVHNGNLLVGWNFTKWRRLQKPTLPLQAVGLT